jgi:hypothetical protein
VNFSMRMPRSEPARHSGPRRAASPRRPPAAPALILLAAPLHHAGSTRIIVSHSRRHSNAVQVRDVPDFIGLMAASSPGPHIPCGAYFLAGGARTRSSAASPICSDLRDRCGPPPLMLQGAPILCGEPYPFMRLRAHHDQLFRLKFLRGNLF